MSEFKINNAAGVGKTSEPSTPTKKDKVGKDEFLNLLVHQLQNQDPLNPMDSQQFAVQLAQFSSLEQLIEINTKLGGEKGSGESSIGTMASFLGQQVGLKDAPLEIRSGRGPDLLVELPRDAVSARVDLLNAEGKVVGSHVVSDLEEGKQALALEGVRVPNGEYSTRVVAVKGNGQFVEVSSRVTGVVEGFVLEPTPALLVNGQQIAMEDVVEVSKPLPRAGS